ncbi:unnamed protein product [Protopolystoma xenopodis]|uniref:Alpha-1,2-Mannosidase n=1 Tax=Protopolystoma xenopodis TaxID=117903 RepID=A0A3S5FBL6_9PLAT|nr:unnamed protein product [Protopolystoma xenopodis]
MFRHRLLRRDYRYEKAALRALRSLWMHRSALDLPGNHIDVNTGKWTASEASIGAGVDSYFEYLVKGSLLFRLPELDAMFREYKISIDRHLRYGDWHFLVNKDKGTVNMPVFQSLEAFWPSLLVLTGDIDSAMRHISTFHSIWKQYGFTPEMYNVPSRSVVPQRHSYPLRPGKLFECV